MITPTQCPSCTSENIYPDGNLWMCPECGNEWNPQTVNGAPASSEENGATDGAVRDAHGNVLSDGDSVTVLKELRIKGSSSAVKVGTKVKNIRLVDGDDGHDISCKIDGLGAINLKSQFVKKS